MIRENLNYIDILFKAAVLIPSIVIFVVLFRLYVEQGRKKMWKIAALGSFFFMLGVIYDIFDEFFPLPVTNIVKNSFLAVGISLVVIGFYAIILENLKLANTDSLTGLYNKRYLQETLLKEIKRAKRYKNNLAVVFIDLDRFKKVNDTGGHLVGDDVLQKVADKLQGVVRESDILTRFGGDEFVIILPCADYDDGIRFFARIQKALDEYVVFQDQSISVSGGVAQYPIDGERPQELLAVASKRMYKNKNK